MPWKERIVCGAEVWYSKLFGSGQSGHGQERQHVSDEHVSAASQSLCRVLNALSRHCDLRTIRL